MTNAVTEVPAAPPPRAHAHFRKTFEFETDCHDTHVALSGGNPGFVLIDARSPGLYAKAHVPGAINLPHGKIVRSRMAAWPENTLFVVYCAGPHCNGAARAAARLAALGYPVKLMAGGIQGWMDEGFELAGGTGA